MKMHFYIEIIINGGEQMGLYTIFGINGIGKDTIAEELRKKNQEIEVTSMSRLLMFILGISKTYDVEYNEDNTIKSFKPNCDAPIKIKKRIIKLQIFFITLHIYL